MHRFRDWTNLPSELVEDLIERMDFPGLFKFRLICSSWRSISSPIFKPIVESLLVIQKDSYDNGSIWIYNPFDAIPYQIQLPPGFTKGKICGFTNGFLVLEEENGGSNLQLLHLLSSSSAISLPLLPVESEHKKLCLSQDQSIAMAITRNKDRNSGILSIFISSLKQQSWKVIEVPSPHMSAVVEDVIFVKGKFYAITTDGLIIIVNASADGLATGVYEMSVFSLQSFFMTTYLGDSLEYGLIFITESTRPERKIRHSVAKSIKEIDEIDENFDYTEETLEFIEDLGDHAVFVSCHHTRVISTSAFPTLQKNMVYTNPDPPRSLRGDLVYANGKPCRLGGRSLYGCTDI